MARPVLRTTARGKQGPVGPQGERGPQGAQGPQGERGLPGVNAVPADEAVAAYIDANDSATHTALAGEVEAGADERIDAKVPADLDNPATPVGAAGTRNFPRWIVGAKGDGGVTDNGPIINDLPENSGRQRLPHGKVVSRRCISIGRNTELFGPSATTTVDGGGVNPRNALIFEGIMSGGHGASVTADGTAWVFTVPEGHGLHPGDHFTTSGFATAGFNRNLNVIESVTDTTLRVIESSIPAASDTGGFVHVHLLTVGRIDATSSDSLVENLTIHAYDVPGAIVVYSNSIQENAGLRRVTIMGHRYRGLLIDDKQTLYPGVRPLNFCLEDIRTIASPLAPPEAAGVEYGGSSASARGITGLTCVGGGADGQLHSQVLIHSAYTGLFERIHVEHATDGVLISPDMPRVQGATFIAVTGGPGVVNVIRVASASTVTKSNRLTFLGVLTNGADRAIVDDVSLYSSPAGADVGIYATDSDGRVSHTTEAPAAPAALTRVSGVGHRPNRALRTTVTGSVTNSHATNRMTAVIAVSRTETGGWVTVQTLDAPPTSDGSFTVPFSIPLPPGWSIRVTVTNGTLNPGGVW